MAKRLLTLMAGFALVASVASADVGDRKDLQVFNDISKAVTRSALMRQESRGGHTRDDFPKTDAEWGKKNVVTRARGGKLELETEPLPQMPEELRQLVMSEEKQGAPA